MRCRSVSALIAFPGVTQTTYSTSGAFPAFRRAKAQRRARRRTVKEAAARIGVSSSRLAELERGKSYHTDHATRPSRDFAERIAEGFGLAPSDVLAEAGFELPAAVPVSKDTARLISLYERLSPDRKALAMEMMRLFARTSEPR